MLRCRRKKTRDGPCYVYGRLFLLSESVKPFFILPNFLLFYYFPEAHSPTTFEWHSPYLPYDVVLAPTENCYLDHDFPKSRANKWRKTQFHRFSCRTATQYAPQFCDWKGYGKSFIIRLEARLQPNTEFTFEREPYARFYRFPSAKFHEI